MGLQISLGRWMLMRIKFLKQVSILADQELVDGASGSVIRQSPVAVAHQSTGIDSLRFAAYYS